ncbi:MAG: DUF971 domain-containing protein [Burkholderiales bacterium]
MTVLTHPVEITNHRGHGLLAITWNDGSTDRLSHRLLRESCQCAHCLAARRAGRRLQVMPGIRITTIEACGANTLNLGFDDGHRRGLYPFDYLKSLAVPASSMPGR